MHCDGYPKRESQPDTPVFVAVTVWPPSHSDTDDVELSTAALKTLESPLDGLLNYSSRSFTQARLANIGVSLLVRNFCDQFKFSTSVFEILLPLLSHALPSVNAAAAALGAIYEVQMLESIDRDPEDAKAADQYGLAVRYMQHDIETQPFGTIPLTMTCMLLACSELLLRRPSYALMHAEAAFNILNAEKGPNNTTSDGIPDFCNDSTWVAPVDEDEMFMLFRAFDLQVSSYADWRTPSMPCKIQKSPSGVMLHPTNIREFEIRVITAIHDCLHFTAGAAPLKYTSTETLQSDVPGEQNRHIASLTALVQNLDRYASPGQANAQCGKPQPESWSLILMLRNLCLSTIILASTILTPYETAFDSYLWHFQQIVLAAEEILQERDSHELLKRDYNAVLQNEKKAMQACFTFTPLPGLIQPLFLTASKCRHPKWRRRAINLLRRSGREGPWIGKLIARVAERVAEVEEAGSGFAMFLFTREEGGLISEDLATGVGPSSIPEGARISGIAMDVDMDVDVDMKKTSELPSQEYQPANWTAQSPGFTHVRFSRCKDIETMLEITQSASNSPLSSQSDSPRHRVSRDNLMARPAFAKNRSGSACGGPKLWEFDESSNDVMPTWRDEQFWDVWDEILEFGGETRKDA